MAKKPATPAKPFNNKSAAPSADDALIAKIEKIIKQHKKDDRDGAYFEGTSTPKFQKAAQELAELIGEQGAKNTNPRLVNLAKEVSKFIDQWGELQGSSVGFIFEKGLKGDKPGNPNNPFANVKLK